MLPLFDTIVSSLLCFVFLCKSFVWSRLATSCPEVFTGSGHICWVKLPYISLCQNPPDALLVAVLRALCDCNQLESASHAVRHLLQIITPPSPPDACSTAAQLPGPDDSPSSSALQQASQAAPGDTSWTTQQPVAEDEHLQQVPKSQQQAAVPSLSQQAQHHPHSADRPGWRGWVEAALDSSPPQSLLSSDTASATEGANQLASNSLQKGPSEPSPEGHMAAAHLQGSSAGRPTPPHHSSSLQSSLNPHSTPQLSSWQDQQSLLQPTFSQQSEIQPPLSNQQHIQHLAATVVTPKPVQEATGWENPPQQQRRVAAGGLPEQIPALSRDKLRLIREACHVVMTLAERQGWPEMLLPVLEGMQQVHPIRMSVLLSVCLSFCASFCSSAILLILSFVHPSNYPSIHRCVHACIHHSMFCVYCLIQSATHAYQLI